ncbi:MAG: hypothetical protein S4CHLAM102_05550 [Chlamydiia bacterium]|nr:hypothetical protein [Chlamydiia bacterium]
MVLDIGGGHYLDTARARELILQRDKRLRRENGDFVDVSLHFMSDDKALVEGKISDLRGRVNVYHLDEMQGYVQYRYDRQQFRDCELWERCHLPEVRTGVFEEFVKSYSREFRNSICGIGRELTRQLVLISYYTGCEGRLENNGVSTAPIFHRKMGMRVDRAHHRKIIQNLPYINGQLKRAHSFSAVTNAKIYPEMRELLAKIHGIATEAVSEDFFLSNWFWKDEDEPVELIADPTEAELDGLIERKETKGWDNLPMFMPKERSWEILRGMHKEYGGLLLDEEAAKRVCALLE